MIISKIAQELGLKQLVEPSDPDLEAVGCYIGDLLSWVMGRAPESVVWITVMGNVNAVAVAKLADISMIVLCENAPLDDEAAVQAARNKVAIYQSELPAYRLALEVSKLMEN